MEEEEREEARFEERSALEAIFGDEGFSEVWYEMGVVVGCEVRLGEGEEVVVVRHDAPSLYPYQPPLLLLKPSPALPPQLSREASRDLNAYAAALCARPG